VDASNFQPEKKKGEKGAWRGGKGKKKPGFFLSKEVLFMTDKMMAVCPEEGGEVGKGEERKKEGH